MEERNEFEKLERALVRAGRGRAYPATPPLVTRALLQIEARARPSVWLPRRVSVAIIALLIALAMLLAFPETREAIAQMLGLRTIRIIPVTPTTTRQPELIVPVTATPLPNFPMRTPAPHIQCCETAIADAQARSKFKILLPPSQSPTRVYLQSIPNFGVGAQQVILIFGEANASPITLYQATNFLYGKIVGSGTVISEVQVKGQRALWLSGAPHLLVYLDANGQAQFESERVVNLNTLAWERGEVTYRIESPLGKEEAIKFAESLE